MERPEERWTLTFREPFGCGHVFFVAWCVVWDVVVGGTTLELLSEGRDVFPLFFPVVIGAVVTYMTIRGLTNRMRLRVAEGRITRRSGPLPPFGAWSIDRADAEAILVTEHWYDNDGDCLEWIVAIRRRFGAPVKVQTFGGDSRRGEAPEVVAALARELEAALRLPIEREKRDERPAARSGAQTAGAGS